MPPTKRTRVLVSAAFGLLSASTASFGEERATKGAPLIDDSGAEKSVAEICANVAPAAREARIAWQMTQLTDVERRLKQRLDELQKAEASAREWIAKRDALEKAAKDDVVAIYAQMDPEAAAGQLSGMDDALAAAILSKLKPKAAGLILGEMETSRASKLASLASASSQSDDKAQ